MQRRSGKHSSNKPWHMTQNQVRHHRRLPQGRGSVVPLRLPRRAHPHPVAAHPTRAARPALCSCSRAAAAVAKKQKRAQQAACLQQALAPSSCMLARI